jgi:hypothetical protein
MKYLYKTVLIALFTSFLISCASSSGVNRSNDTFYMDKETMIDHTKNAIRENSLRIYDEETRSDGGHEFTVYRPEGRLFTSENPAVNRIRIILTPIEDEEGFKVAVQQPSTHAMARTASTVDYRSRILRTLNQLIHEEDDLVAN